MHVRAGCGSRRERGDEEAGVQRRQDQEEHTSLQ